MRQEIMSHYGITREFSKAGFYETEQHRQILRELKSAVQQGKFVTMSGIVGCGKTTTLHRLQEQLETEGEILVARSLSVDKEGVTLAALLVALFADLAGKPSPPWQSVHPSLTVFVMCIVGLSVAVWQELHPADLRSASACDWPSSVSEAGAVAADFLRA